MKKPVKLGLFNLCFIILAILLFSKRCLGLGFDVSAGALHFAISISLSVLGFGLFCFINYSILTKTEVIKTDKLEDIEDCMDTLERFKKTKQSFLPEIETAIKQLHTLERKQLALNQLLQQNDIAKSFNYLKNTTNQANYYVFSNVKRIINRLTAFDNKEYLDNQNDCDISSYKNYINSALEDNSNILNEYNSLLIALSSVGDSTKTNLDDIKSMTEALSFVLNGSNTFNDYTQSENDTFKEDKHE